MNSAISGDTHPIFQNRSAAVYQVGDGAKLYDIPMEKRGKPYPDDVAGGARLLVSYDCAISAVGDRSYSQLQEIDPRTGKVLWRFRTQPGWKAGKVLSADPVVFTTLHFEDRTDNWRVVALGPGGKLSTTIDARPKGFTHCADAGESGESIKNCPGTVVGKGVVCRGGNARVDAYDLGTGKLVWGVKSGYSTLFTPCARNAARPRSSTRQPR